MLAERIQPGAALTAVLGLAGFLWVEMRGIRAEIQAGEAGQNKRIDGLKDDLKDQGRHQSPVVGPGRAESSSGQGVSLGWCGIVRHQPDLGPLGRGLPRQAGAVVAHG